MFPIKENHHNGKNDLKDCFLESLVYISRHYLNNIVVQVEPFLTIVFLVGSKNKFFLKMSSRIPFYPEHKLWNSILNSQAHDDGQE